MRTILHVWMRWRDRRSATSTLRTKLLSLLACQHCPYFVLDLDRKRGSLFLDHRQLLLLFCGGLECSFGSLSGFAAFLARFSCRSKRLSTCLHLLISEDAVLLCLDLQQFRYVLLADFVNLCLLVLRKLNTPQHEHLLKGGLLRLLGSPCVLRQKRACDDQRRRHRESIGSSHDCPPVLRYLGFWNLPADWLLHVNVMGNIGVESIDSAQWDCQHLQSRSSLLLILVPA